LARERGGIGGGTPTEAAKGFAADALALAPFNAAIAYVDNGDFVMLMHESDMPRDTNVT
jgi:hypothetical protein